MTAADVERAKSAGASDRAIHDTVLIAAAFSMYNRYVDGLGAEAPTDKGFYEATAVRLATKGYTCALPREARPTRTTLTTR